MSALIEFLNASLRNDSHFSIESEYPSLFDPRFGGKSLIEKDQENFVSHLGYLIRDYRHPHFCARIAMIGSVVTDPSYRGRGHASRLINQALEEISKEKVSLVILWSDRLEFYRKLGFYRVGQEWDFLIDPKLPKRGIHPCRPVQVSTDLLGIYRLFSRHNYQVQRSPEEMESYLKIPELRCFVTESEGEIDSYVCINKGADFTGVIHEWGGEISAVCKNIQGCQERYYSDKPLVLISPASQEYSGFETISKSKTWGVLGLVKVLNRDVLMEQYLDWNQVTGSLRKEKEDFIKGLNDEAFLSLCFGDAEKYQGKPLPFFLWGFDSI